MPPPRATASRTIVGRLEARPAAVLVEPVAEVRAGVPGRGSGPGARASAGLRVERPERVQRVADIARSTMTRSGRTRVARVDRDAVLDGARQRLQPVHVVGHRQRVARAAAVGGRDVPRGPGPRVRRQDALVGVEHDRVASCTRSRRGRAARGRRRRRAGAGRRRRGSPGRRRRTARGRRRRSRSSRRTGRARHVDDRVARPHRAGGQRGDEALDVGRASRRGRRATAARCRRRSGRGCRGSAAGSRPGTSSIRSAAVDQTADVIGTMKWSRNGRP